ncbi:hypothetical protein TNCV_5106031 [Trichonephila clavipes]|nr:hypothetical protein TNCV_5106031 [Trichonephila clavipes]
MPEDRTRHILLRKLLIYRWTKMITLVQTLLLTNIDITETHSPISESVDRLKNDIVIMVSMIVVAVASSMFDGMSVASCLSDGFFGCFCGE